PQRRPRLADPAAAGRGGGRRRGADRLARLGDHGRVPVRRVGPDPGQPAAPARRRRGHRPVPAELVRLLRRARDPDPGGRPGRGALMELLMEGFANALTPENLMYAVIGVLLGTAVGVLPGIGPAMTVALLLPITYNVEPAGAL